MFIDKIQLPKNLQFSSLSALSGVMAVLAFPPFELAVLGWFALVPLLFVISRSTLKEAFLYSYLAGVVFFSGLIYWLSFVTVPAL